MHIMVKTTTTKQLNTEKALAIQLQSRAGILTWLILTTISGISARIKANDNPIEYYDKANDD